MITLTSELLKKIVDEARRAGLGPGSSIAMYSYIYNDRTEVLRVVFNELNRSFDIHDDIQWPDENYWKTPLCDKNVESAFSPVPHKYKEIGEEYSSFGSGGSYDKLQCTECGRIAYSPMAD